MGPLMMMMLNALRSRGAQPRAKQGVAHYALCRHFGTYIQINDAGVHAACRVQTGPNVQPQLLQSLETITSTQSTKAHVRRETCNLQLQPPYGIGTVECRTSLNLTFCLAYVIEYRILYCTSNGVRVSCCLELEPQKIGSNCRLCVLFIICPVLRTVRRLYSTYRLYNSCSHQSLYPLLIFIIFLLGANSGISIKYVPYERQKIKTHQSTRVPGKA